MANNNNNNKNQTHRSMQQNRELGNKAMQQSQLIYDKDAKNVQWETDSL